MSTAPGHTDYDDGGVNQTTRAGGWLLWLLVVVIVVAAVIGMLLLGPFGLAVAIPLAVLLFVIFGTSSSGPAAGA
jgi:hypothetical protein